MFDRFDYIAAHAENLILDYTSNIVGFVQPEWTIEERHAFISPFYAYADAFLVDVMDLIPEDCSHADAQAIFHNLDTDIVSADELRAVPVGSVPPLVVRYLVAKRHLPFHMNRMPAFRAFAERYRSVIMG